mmetsp:Transcript_126245/g.315623  ORF Transcript_126245/g.315623 Transcript_126245/m.315623 type:complete len:231 (-) Transcript_126245:281-973(-)
MSCGICVLFPQPASPKMQVTRPLPLRASCTSSSRSLTGSLALSFAWRSHFSSGSSHSSPSSCQSCPLRCRFAGGAEDGRFDVGRGHAEAAPMSPMSSSWSLMKPSSSTAASSPTDASCQVSTSSSSGSSSTTQVSSSTACVPRPLSPKFPDSSLLAPQEDGRQAGRLLPTLTSAAPPLSRNSSSPPSAPAAFPSKVGAANSIPQLASASSTMEAASTSEPMSSCPSSSSS